MTKSSECRDTLAYRLGEIVGRLFSGRKLSLSDLANEFNVCERTIYRDLNERLKGLDIIKKDADFYYLSSTQIGSRNPISDMLKLARITCLEKIFPSFDGKLDRKFITLLLESKSSPFILYLPNPKGLITSFGSFITLTKAITHRCCLNLIDNDNNEYKNYHLYRLIYSGQQWFLAGVVNNNLQVLSFHNAFNVELIEERHFEFDNNILETINSESFIETMPRF